MIFSLQLKFFGWTWAGPVVLLALATLPVVATEMPAAFLACKELHDSGKRLRCYDLAVADMSGNGSGAPESPSVPRSAPPTAELARDLPAGTNATVDTFGLSSRHESSRFVRDESEQLDTVTAQIVRIEEMPRGERRVLLDNGQVWEETSRNRKLLLDTGDKISIRKAAFGSFKLIGPGGK